MPTDEATFKMAKDTWEAAQAAYAGQKTSKRPTIEASISSALNTALKTAAVSQDAVIGELDVRVTVDDYTPGDNPAQLTWTVEFRRMERAAV